MEVTMEFLDLVGTALLSVIVIFVLTKLMGNKQLSQINMFDYIIGITIGSIAAEMATEIDGDMWKPLTAMAVYAAVSVLITFIGIKSVKFRKFVYGKTVILYDNGKLFGDNLRKAGIDLNEFLMQCRNAGYFDLSEIKTAIQETNGHISFLPASDSRPVTPKDMHIKTKESSISPNVIIDGKIISEALRNTGNNEVWLRNKLSEHGIKDVGDVFLGVCVNGKELQVFRRDGGGHREVFE